MKKIFISHSSKDAEFCMRFCDQLEENELPCWIAPRDISYGEKWAEEIADNLISGTWLFVLILSENSNQSKQVLKEINIAINYDIPMLIISIEHIKKLNLSFVYYLSNLHIYECYAEQESSALERMVDLVLRKKKRLNSNEQCQSHPNAKPVIQVNIESELVEKFNHLFGLEGSEDYNLPKTHKSDGIIRHKLNEIMVKNLFAIWTNLDPYKDTFPVLTSQPNEIFPEKPLYGTNVLPRFFSLHEPKDTITLIYQINRMIDPDTYDIYYKNPDLHTAPEEV